MKHADKIISLLEAYPGRNWKMAEVVRYVSPRASIAEKGNLRRAVLRVLNKLVEIGVVQKTPHSVNGGHALYLWK